MEDRRLLRPCYRCLLRDLDPDKYMEQLKSYIERIQPEDRADPELYEKRLKTCTLCKELSSGMCRACGCFVELRASGISGSCPYDRW